MSKTIAPTPTTEEVIIVPNPEIVKPENLPISVNFASALEILNALEIAEYFAKKNSATELENDYLIHLLNFTNGTKKSIKAYLASLEEKEAVTEELPEIQVEGATVVEEETKTDVVDDK